MSHKEMFIIVLVPNNTVNRHYIHLTFLDSDKVVVL